MIRHLTAAILASAVIVGLLPAGSGAAPAPSTPPVPTTTTPGGAGSTATTVPDSAGATVPGQRAATEQQVDVLRASLDDVRAEIAAVDGRLAEESRRLELSRLATQLSRERAAEAAGRAAAAHTAAERAHDAAREYAVEAFIRPPTLDSLAVLSLTTAQDAGYASRMLRTVADERREVLDRMTEAEARAAGEELASRAAATAAEAQARQAEAQVVDLEAARVQQVGLAAGLDDRLDRALSEATALREIDQRAARELAERELALRRSGAASVAGAVAVPATVPATRSAAPATPTASRPPTSPGATAPAAPRPSNPGPPPPPTAGSGVVTRAEVVSVRGILVHRSIASQVERLLAAASAAGVALSGSGWRDTSRQIELRQQHCGTTPYAIYEMPADQCIPPVARPGRSMHERGLAVDFVVGGDLIRTRSHGAYQWLAANASRFGLFNLPSEPWHWSTTGT